MKRFEFHMKRFEFHFLRARWRARPWRGGLAPLPDYGVLGGCIFGWGPFVFLWRRLS